MILGTRLKQLRKDKRLTLQQVADHLGVNPSTISTYENNKRTPTYDKISQFADLYEVTTDDIIGHITETDNLRKILRNNKLHWDGIEIQEKELEIIRHFLEYAIASRPDHERENDKKDGTL